MINFLPIWEKMNLKLALESSKNVDMLKHTKPTVYLLDLPGHNNLGDEAIGISEVNFLKKYSALYDYDLEFYSCLDNIFSRIKWLKKNISPKDIIVCQGGGNMGDLYPYYEYIRLIIIKSFPNNKIVIFPQTYYVEDTKNRIYNLMKKVYNSHNKLVIYAREEKSYQLLQKDFKNNRVLLAPDMVLSYPYYSKGVRKQNRKVLFCLRNDKEKGKNEKNIEVIEKNVQELGYDISFTDTMEKEGKTYDSLESAKKAVDKKIEEFSTAKLVVTDRLHGMVLSILGGTNCLALDNSTHKIKGVYKWINGVEGVQLFDSSRSVVEQLENILKENLDYDFQFFLDNLEEMGREIFLH